MQDNHKTLVLCILDGWGISKKKDISHNAIAKGHTPNWDFLLNNFSHAELETSGQSVGLPPEQMGNSEVGHMTMGSGRVIYQDLVRINQAITNNSFINSDLLLKLIFEHKDTDKVVHLMGLCSDGGVHSHIDHLIFISSFLGQNNVKVKLHLFLDGRDVPLASAAKFLTQIDALLSNPNISIASLSGRFYAMDRDNRWERCELAYKAIAEGIGHKIKSWKEYIGQQYEENIFDEFIVPAVFEGYEGIKSGDSILFTNYRSDRVRQLARSLVSESFDFFNRKNFLLKYKIGMTKYSSDLSKEMDVLFPEQKISNGLGEVISANNLTQLRLAETEKYAHVTFFFNGGKEEVYPGEDRILVPSPKVHTYDLNPEMSAFEVTEELLKAIDSRKYNIIVVNYANADMVGHSGKMLAAQKAVEAIDVCLGRIYNKIEQHGDILMITADHGNVEEMFDLKHNIDHTSHTLNPVPFVLVGVDAKLSNGSLSDIAPTILDIINIEKPREMTGRTLLKKGIK